MAKKWMTIILMSLIAVLLAGTWFILKDVDRTRPEITFGSNIPSYREGDDTQVLLANVSAYDDRDGNLTSKVQVNQITPIDHGTRASVTYVVIDSQNNIATATQIVEYTPLSDESAADALDESASDVPTYEEAAEEAEPGSPFLVLSAESDMIKASDSFNYMSYIAAVSDDVDSEEYLFQHIVIEGDYSSTTAGTYPLTIYVTDSDNNESNRETFILYRV
ncbi:MAG: hypothetical protein Q4A32_05710 [Lachnospiraceae bacterium]|nr:hypothetical protein [Lachnospiraceae bacterium]